MCHQEQKPNQICIVNNPLGSWGGLTKFKMAFPAKYLWAV